MGACADDLCGACSIACSRAGDRSRSLLRLARKLPASAVSAAMTMLLWLASTLREFLSAFSSLVPTPALLRASSLRI
jgi:hypothetical protein